MKAAIRVLSATLWLGYAFAVLYCLGTAAVALNSNPPSSGKNAAVYILFAVVVLGGYLIVRAVEIVMRAALLRLDQQSYEQADVDRASISRPRIRR